MVEPDKKDHNKTAALEDTVRNLREENAKLLQLLRSQGLLLDSSTNQNGKSSDTIFPISNQKKDSTSITFDHSDLSVTTNSINKSHNQHINNQSSINQQSYNGQTVNGNQSNISPSFNTVIQTTSQPFVQNSSNTLVQNNTNLIQPINLVNFNHVSLDSIQSFFASQNNLVYLSQTSSSSATTTAEATSTNSIISNTNLNESLPSNTHSILPSSSSESHNKIIIRPKLSLLHQNQELVPVIPKIRPEHYEKITRHLSSSLLTNSDTNSSSVDSDSNNDKHKYPRSIRPKLSSRTSSLKVSNSVSANRKRIAAKRNTFSSLGSLVSYDSSTVSLLSAPGRSTVSSSRNYLSQCSTLEHEIDLSPQLIHSRSLDLSIPSMNQSLLVSLPITANKKSSKTRMRNRKKTSVSSAIVPSNSHQSLVSVASSTGQLLTPAIISAQRAVTSNNPITKRSTINKKQTKRNNSKTLVRFHSETILQQNSLSPTNSYAESISGLLESFDPELLASNFLNQTITTTTTSNLLSDENDSVISSNTNMLQTSDNFNVRHVPDSTVQHHESYHVTSTSMPTLEEFNNQLENGGTAVPIRSCHDLRTTHHYNAENEPMTSFMSEEDMRFVEMNFDENVFLKQFDLDDPGIKLSVHSDQNIFSNILINNNDALQMQQQNQNNEQSPNLQNQSVPPTYSGSSLINNSVFTTVVPLSSQQQTQTPNVLNNNNNNDNNDAIALLPEEGFQLTARHIEPSQVATYESANYQDILDDLVMVTDQDVLRHVQAAAANDPSLESADFSLALLEAANEIMKSTNIQIVEQNSSAFAELQYFYPMEQQQANLEKQLEISENIEKNLTHDDQQPIVTLENLQSQIITSTNSAQNTVEESIINTSINDLSSMLQFDQPQSSIVDHDRLTTNLITPIRTTKNISHLLALNSPPPPSSSTSSSTAANSNDKNNDINIDCHLALSSVCNNDSFVSYSPISDILAIASNSVQQQLKSSKSITNSSITFQPVILPTSPSSPLKSSKNELIIDSGHLDELITDKVNFQVNHDDTIEDLLRDTNDNQYDIIENQGQSSVKSSIVIDNVDELIERIETSSTSESIHKVSLEQTFLRYQEKYYTNLKHRQNLSTRKFKRQATIPTVKLKIPSQNILLKENQTNYPSSPKKHDQDSNEYVPLNNKIRTTLSSTISTENKIQNKKIHKTKKQKSHHHHHHHSHNNHKKKSVDKQPATECVAVTSFEQPIAQLYHQSSPPTPAETIAKDEILTSPSTTIMQQSESESLSNNIHSGFMINEQTPPSSITSIEHKESPPPLLINQTKNEKLKMNYSHLFNYDNNNDHQNNNTYVTPPPETDNSLSHQKSTTYDNFCRYSNSPNKKKHHHRKSSVTSSTSSKSLNNLDYAIDTQDLEPVSPTPLSTSKKHNSQNQSSSSNYNDVSPHYYEQQQKRSKKYRSRKSSSNRASRIASSQFYSQSRALSNHSYRTSQEPPLIPPILPVPPPPPPPPRPPIHMEPYGPPYHPFAPRAGPPPFFNFPYSNPFLNSRPSAPPAHFHPHSMKYHHHRPNIRPPHGFPTHPPQYPYHGHLQRQQQYNSSNYMTSRDHHSFDR